jgi:hypothetical protein
LNQIFLGIRTRKHSGTGYSPYFLAFGIEPRLPGDVRDEVVLESSVAALVLELNVLPGLRASLVREPTSSSSSAFFSVGQMAMVFSGTVLKNLITDKKKPRYFGPFQIIRELENKMYQCQNEYGQKELFHVSRLVFSLLDIRLSIRGGVGRE